MALAVVGTALLLLAVTAMWWWPASAPFPAEDQMSIRAADDTPQYQGWFPLLQDDEPLLRARPITSSGMRTQLFVCHVEQPADGGLAFGTGDAELVEETCERFLPVDEVGLAPVVLPGYEAQVVVEMVAVEAGPQHVCGVEFLRRTGWLVRRHTPSLSATLVPADAVEVSDEELEASYRRACG